MNSILLILLLLCPLFDAHFYTFECNLEKNCTCYKVDEFEIHCPIATDESNPIIIHINKSTSEILIDCPPYKLKKFSLHQLPKLTVSTTNFRIRFCPWPDEEFHKIFDKFSLNNVTFLEFCTSSSNDTTLKKDYLKGLETIERLKLSDAQIVDIDEEAFVNTPNLQVLELEDNKIILKKNLFQNVPQLIFLDLSGNSLKDIPPGVFQPLKKLKTLHLWNNNLRTLDGTSFKDLTLLESLELSTNKIKRISEDAFQKLEALETINLSGNKIKKVPANLFRHNKVLRFVGMESNFNLTLADYFFANLSVSQVVLSNCNLESIPEHIFENCFNLKFVNLQRNELVDLPENLFKGLTNLESIGLQDNRIQSVSKVFHGLKRLKSLHLQNNLIDALTFQDFADLENLEKINLRQNRISVVDVKLFNHKSHLQVINLAHNFLNSALDQIITLNTVSNLSKLDLSHNLISQIKLSDLKPVTDIFIKLDHNQITFVDFENFDFDTIRTKISLEHNPIACDCQNYDLVEYFKKRRKEKFDIDISVKNLQCGNPPELKSMSDVSLPDLTCPLERQCPKKCLCSWRPFDKSLVVDCSYRNLTKFPKIDQSQIASFDFNQTELDLEGNRLTLGPENSTSLQNVTKLILSGNKIERIEWLPPNLKILILDHNNLSFLNHDVVKMLNQTSLINLTLHDNPWACDCGSEVLSDFLRTLTTPINTANIFCHETKQRLIDLKKDDFCDTWKNLHLILIGLSVLVILSICGVAYCSRKQQIKVWLFSKKLCLWWVTEQEVDRDKTYDAFVSYSHKDDDFVTEELLPVLDPRYKLCLHFRDWTPGEFIHSQIVDSVLDSRRTVVVLSKNFLESVWGKTEFRTAHSQAMKDGRTRVIIILLEDIDVDDLDEELKIYLNTNTYVKWKDPYFWNKLKYALPHKRIASGSRRRLVSEDYRLIE